jgi:D-aspartate oxidase
MTCYMHSCCRQYGQSVAAMGLGLYSKRKKVLVIGCGVVGLNTALRIQKDMPEVVVTIMAEQLAENVVSNVAAGFFRATTSIRGPTPELTKLWIKEAWNYWSHLLKTTSPKQAGIFEVHIKKSSI